MDLLKNDSEHLYGKSSGELQGADFDKGAFLFPQLFYAKNPLTTESVHSVEAFALSQQLWVIRTLMRP